MRTLTRLAALGAVLAAVPAPAQDAFELQVYDSETAAPGQVGAELHVNTVLDGRRERAGVELPTHHVTHLTVEPHLGVTDWLELGAYVSTAVRADGTFDFAGLKARVKLRWPKKLAGVVGLALNQELSATSALYEAGQYAWELRPIVDLDWDRLYLALNPNLAVPLGGAEAGHPEFEPCFKASVRVLPFLAVGAEYLGAFGPLAHPTPLGEQSHRVFGALDLDWTWGRHAFQVDLAAGYDLTGPDKAVAKLIVAVDLLPQPE